jgi:hypothetical protein
MKDKIKKQIDQNGQVTLYCMEDANMAGIALFYAYGVYANCKDEGCIVSPYGYDTRVLLDDETMSELQEADTHDIETFFAGLTYVSVQEKGKPMFFILNGKVAQIFLRKPLHGNTVLG